MRKLGLLDLNEAVQHPGRRVHAAVSTALESEEDLDLAVPVAGEIVAWSTGNALIVEARLATTVVLECARCGEPVETPLEFTLRDEFDVEGIPAAYSPEGSAKILCEEPGLFVGNSLVEDEFVRQGVWLNLPVQPVCGAEGCGTVVDAPDDGSQGHPAMQDLGRIVREVAG